MSLVLDPSKQFVSITIYYIEEELDHGNSVFRFIKSKDEFEEWKAKGYKPRQEIEQLLNPKPQIQPSGPVSAEDTKKEPEPVEDKKIIEQVSTHWKRLTWKDQNVIFSQSLKTIAGPDGQTHSDLDPLSYRDLKLKTCLKSWDLKDDQGNPVKITHDVIDNLTPEVASELIANFERVTEPSENDLK